MNRTFLVLTPSH